MGQKSIMLCSRGVMALTSVNLSKVKTRLWFNVMFHIGSAELLLGCMCHTPPT